ncbi:MAG: PEP-CTERM sorting domain-containing protein [Desulfobulbaceae bacterium]|nr:PEP-CTERM sorting domain-containing protein [Desulfobulbaceae bacterium]
MWQWSKTPITVFAGLIMAAILAVPPALATPIFSLGSPLSGAVGDEVSVDLNLDLADGDSLFSADFTITYDSSYLEYLGASVVHGYILLLDDFIGAPSPNPITFTLSVFDQTTNDGSFYGPNSYELADLTFRIIGGGQGDQTLIRFGNLDAYDDLSTNPISAVTSDNSVTITDTAPIPEPTTMLLLGTGLAGLGAMRTQRRKRATHRLPTR